MNRRLFNRAGFGLLAGLGALFGGAALAAGPGPAPGPEKKDDGDGDDEDHGHQLVIQVSSGDRQVQALALGNAANYAAYYKDKKEKYAIEIVAYGPGYQMVRGDMSMMKGDIANLQQELGDTLTISGCQNTRKAIAAEMGKTPADIPQLPGVKDTPSGVVRIAELQEDGWAYIKP